MNNIFSFERFLKVLRYDLKMRVPAIGVMFLVFLVMPHALHMIMDFNGTFRESLRIEVIGVMLVWFLYFAPFSIYSSFREKHGIGAYLMIPASVLEKFASMVSVCLVIVPVAFCLCSFLVDSLFTVVLKNSYGGFISLRSVFNEYEAGRVLLVFFTLVGASLLGNLLFRKRASSKTVLALLLLTFLGGVLIIDNIVDFVFNDGYVDASVLEMKRVRLDEIYTMSVAAIGLLFYILAYWRLKKIPIS